MIRKIEVFNNNGEPITKDFVYDGSLDNKGIKRKFNIVFFEFYRVFDLFGSKGRIVKFLLLNVNRNNQIKITNKELAKKIKVSERLVKNTIKELKEIGFISRVGSVITINPFYFDKSINDYKNNILFYKKGEFNENS